MRQRERQFSREHHSPGIPMFGLGLVLCYFTQWRHYRFFDCGTYHTVLQLLVNWTIPTLPFHDTIFPFNFFTCTIFIQGQKHFRWWRVCVELASNEGFPTGLMTSFKQILRFPFFIVIRGWFSLSTINRAKTQNNKRECGQQDLSGFWDTEDLQIYLRNSKACL